MVAKECGNCIYYMPERPFSEIGGTSSDEALGIATLGICELDEDLAFAWRRPTMECNKPDLFVNFPWLT